MTVAGVVYSFLIIILVVFQMALASGAALGAFTMGGRYPGQLPPYLRQAAAIQAMILTTMGLSVADRSGILDLNWYPLIFWVATGLTALTALGSTVTASKAERLAFAPITIAMLACVIIIVIQT